MFRKIDLFSSEDKKISWWWLGVKVGVVVGLIVWWWLENRNKEFKKETANKAVRDEIQSIPLPVDVDTPDENVAVKTSESIIEQPMVPDDLTMIEGIGPKINRTLQDAGIHTFIQLAASDPVVLKQILVDAGIRIGYPDTWPEQAALAAKADWPALEVFQGGLKGGRRVS